MDCWDILDFRRHFRRKTFDANKINEWHFKRKSSSPRAIQHLHLNTYKSQCSSFQREQSSIWWERCCLLLLSLSSRQEVNLLSTLVLTQTVSTTYLWDCATFADRHLAGRTFAGRTFAGRAGRNICRPTFADWNSAGRDICRLCRSRHLPTETFAGRDRFSKWIKKNFKSTKCETYSMFEIVCFSFAKFSMNKTTPTFVTACSDCAYKKCEGQQGVQFTACYTDEVYSGTECGCNGPGVNWKPKEKADEPDSAGRHETAAYEKLKYSPNLLFGSVEISRLWLVVSKN